MLTSKCIAAEGFHLQAHVLLEHSFFQDFLQSLLIDTSSSLFSINTAILTQLLPHLVLVLPKRLPEVVPLTLLILQRALCWPAIRRAIIPNKPSQSPHQNPRDDPAWREIEGMDDEDEFIDDLHPDISWRPLTSSSDPTVASSLPSPDILLCFLLGLFPCNTLLFLRSTRKYLQLHPCPQYFTKNWTELINQQFLLQRGQVSYWHIAHRHKF